MSVKKTSRDIFSILSQRFETCGEDEIGIWVDIRIYDVVQRMRWLEPGTFMMGSPLTEPERFENEIQHKVEITQGFLMSDTTCTQELWQAVMHNNPSGFRGPQRPVENVCFQDCQNFLEIVNDTIKSFYLRLPTEAEWEYACRAGTTTSYCFGDKIDFQQINYNRAGLVIFWNETVDVKSRPSNRWGLYQMHGNVREWCSDWYGEYSEHDTVDPKGPKTGESRVLRGGSWFSRARGCRSAARISRSPMSREENYGFRFVCSIE